MTLDSQPQLSLLNKYQMAMSHAQMGFWEYDLESDLFSWDAGISQLYKVDVSLTKGKLVQWLRLVHKADRRAIREKFLNSLIGLSEFNTLFRVSLDKGSSKYIRTSAFKLRDESGKMTGLAGISWDVTNEILLQEQLNKSKKFLENMIDAIPDPIFIKDQNLNNIYANSAYENLIGLKKSQFLNQPDQNFLSPEVVDSCLSMDLEALRQNKTLEQEEFFQKKASEKQQYILTKKRSFKIDESSSDQFIIGIIRDITEIKNIQKSIIEKTQLASLGEMTAKIAHEINNPLMIIHAKVMILLEQIKDGKISEITHERLMKDLASVEKNSLRIEKTIKSLRSAYESVQANMVNDHEV